MIRRGRPGEEAICRADESGADYYRIFPRPGDIEIQKLLYDSFHGTDFDAQLRARGIDTLIVCGLSTDCCVDQTARSAFHHDYDVFVASDACAAYEPGLHENALNALEKNCVLLTTTQAVEAAWTR
jgi:nicotinamidase-related amidase